MQAGHLVTIGGVTVTSLWLLLAAGCSSAGPKNSAAGPAQVGAKVVTVTGTVRHIDVEGGFYGLVDDDGTKWDPVNLPKDFRKDGVRVRVRAEELKNRVSTHMWGTLIRIVEIRRLPPMGETAP